MTSDLIEDPIIHRLQRLSTALVCDAFLRTGLRTPEQVVVRGVQAAHSIEHVVIGRARTQQMGRVRDHERSSALSDRELSFRLAEGAEPGDFLVIAAPHEMPYAIFGGMLALKAQSRGAVGAVVDGAARDSAEIRTLGLPLWCRGVTMVPGGYAGSSVLDIDVPVVCGGVEIRPGDYIVADGDGVVVVPSEDVEMLLPKCEEMMAAELQTREALLSGRTMVDSYPSREYYRSQK